tara:strand:+ start:126 stop:347 length:222 start_codon:yes stop_codon:yes gene_type:complete
MCNVKFIFLLPFNPSKLALITYVLLITITSPSLKKFDIFLKVVSRNFRPLTHNIFDSSRGKQGFCAIKLEGRK